MLGQDVYDKLLLIQALRESFPDAIFFTDTLDARYLNPAVLGYTRNLVVASPFGLELNRNLQLGATPFRGSEQVAIFLATQVALAPDAPDGEPLAHLHQQLRPLLFEIGRTYAVPLVPPPQPDGERADRGRRVKTLPRPHDLRRRLRIDFENRCTRQSVCRDNWNSRG